MFYESILDVEDKSYYVDKLVTLTQKPRSHWGYLSLSTLRLLTKEKVRKDRVKGVCYETMPSVA